MLSSPAQPVSSLPLASCSPLYPRSLANKSHALSTLSQCPSSLHPPPRPGPLSAHSPLEWNPLKVPTFFPEPSSLSLLTLPLDRCRGKPSPLHSEHAFQKRGWLSPLLSPPAPPPCSPSGTQERSPVGSPAPLRTENTAAITLLQASSTAVSSPLTCPHRALFKMKTSSTPSCSHSTFENIQRLTSFLATALASHTNDRPVSPSQRRVKP